MNRIVFMNVPFSPVQMQAMMDEVAAHGGCAEVITADRPDAAEIVAESDGLIGYFPGNLLGQAKKLKWLQLPCAGADRYVSDALYPVQDFTLTNSAGAFGIAIAEQLVMGALMLLRRMPEYGRQQREKVWKRVGGLGFLHGAKVTILGTGNLGGTFAAYAGAMGARCIGVSRSGTATAHFAAVYPMEQIKEAVRDADIVAACLPLTEKTRGLLDRELFGTMKDGVLFLNVGRGKTVNQADLIEALKDGKVAGAMLDVVEEEPLPASSPLWEMEQVIITPHSSGSDLDAHNLEFIYEIAMDNLRRYLEGRPLRNVVDRKIGY